MMPRARARHKNNNRQLYVNIIISNYSINDCATRARARHKVNNCRFDFKFFVH